MMWDRSFLGERYVFSLPIIRAPLPLFVLMTICSLVYLGGRDCGHVVIDRWGVGCVVAPVDWAGYVLDSAAYGDLRVPV